MLYVKDPIHFTRNPLELNTSGMHEYNKFNIQIPGVLVCVNNDHADKIIKQLSLSKFWKYIEMNLPKKWKISMMIINTIKINLR